MAKSIVPQKPRSKGKLSPKKVILIIAAVVVVLTAAGFAFSRTEPGEKFFEAAGDKIGGIFSNKSDDTDTADTDTDTTPRIIDETYAAASDDIQSGNTQGAISTYEKAISEAATDSEKASLNRKLATALWNGDAGVSSDEQKQLALKYALEAERLYPTIQSAALLSLIYRQTGNIPEAQKYEVLVNERDDSEWKNR